MGFLSFLFMILFFTVSCQSGFSSDRPVPSGREGQGGCSSENSQPPAKLMPGESIKCHNMVTKAIQQGQKDGVCYDGPLSAGEGARHPDIEKCKARMDAAKKKCQILQHLPKIQELPVK